MCTYVIHGSITSSSPIVRGISDLFPTCRQIAQTVLCEPRENIPETYDWSERKICLLFGSSAVMIGCIKFPLLVSCYLLNLLLGCFAISSLAYRIISHQLQETNEASQFLDSSSIGQEDQAEVARLMEQFSPLWDPSDREFNFSESPFNLSSFGEKLRAYGNIFEPERYYDSEIHLGYIEKFDLSPSEDLCIYVRADLHGDLKSLMENLKSLRDLNVLTSDYRCSPGAHLVFLGDYCDRGAYGTQILELLMALKMENRSQVHLLRGNHEDTRINLNYSSTDPRLQMVLWTQEYKAALARFYASMPLSMYLSVQAEGAQEYVQFTHGLFEVTTDPSPLLEDPASYGLIPVSKTRMFSERVSAIAADDGSTMAEAARRLARLVPSALGEIADTMTAYNWGDVTEGPSRLGDLASRQYALNAKDIRDYLSLSSTIHYVSMVLRGHQHQHQHLQEENGEGVIVTTLPVGMDSPYKDHLPFSEQPDRAYIMGPEVKIGEWKKHALLRYSGEEMSEITEGFPLRSDLI